MPLLQNISSFQNKVKQFQHARGRRYYSRISRAQNYRLTESERLTWYLIKRLANFYTQQFSIPDQFKYVGNRQSLRTFQYNVKTLLKYGLLKKAGKGVYTVIKSRRGRPVRQEVIEAITNKQDAFIVSFFMFLAWYRGDHRTLTARDIAAALGIRYSRALECLRFLQAYRGDIKRDMREMVFYCQQPAYWHYRQGKRQWPDARYNADLLRCPICVYTDLPNSSIFNKSNPYRQRAGNEESPPDTPQPIEQQAVSIAMQTQNGKRDCNLLPIRDIVRRMTGQPAPVTHARRTFREGGYSRFKRKQRYKPPPYNKKAINQDFLNALSDSAKAFIMSARIPARIPARIRPYRRPKIDFKKQIAFYYRGPACRLKRLTTICQFFVNFSTLYFWTLLHYYVLHKINDLSYLNIDNRKKRVD